MADFKVPSLPVHTYLHKRPSTAPSTDNKLSDGSESDASPDTSIIHSEYENQTDEEDPTRTSLVLTSSQDQTLAQELSYTEPNWSGRPSSHYLLSIIKNGVEIDSVDLVKPYCVIGRLPICDVHLEHPSISRYHAILQHKSVGTPNAPESTLFSTNPRDIGFYLYDLGSVHGTFLNKNKIEPRCYYRVRVGQTMRFGGSSRIFVLDQSMESVQEVVEAEAEAERKDIQEKREKYQELLAAAEAEKIKKEQMTEALGVTWGLLTEDDFMSERRGEEREVDSSREEYYVNDPKKVLNKFFDREGLELEYETEESDTPSGKMYTVRVLLPIEDLSGEPVYAEGTQEGKKKEAVIKCALEACRLLDAEDILRHPMKHHKRQKRDWEENDYYDSDEDNFLDRTGDVDRKRKIRMKRVGKIGDTVETFESLISKLTVVEEELNKLHMSLDKSNKSMATTGDSLDSFMKCIGSQVDKQKQSEMKLRIHQLKKEEEYLRRLVRIAKPCGLPSTTTEQQQTTAASLTDMRRVDEIQIHTTSRDSFTSQPLSCDNSDSSLSSVIPVPSFDIPKEPSPKAIKNRLIGPSLPSMKAAVKEKPDQKDNTGWFEEDNEEFASWLPPEDQTGDGKTKLNERFGY